MYLKFFLSIISSIFVLSCAPKTDVQNSSDGTDASTEEVYNISSQDLDGNDLSGVNSNQGSDDLSSLTSKVQSDRIYFGFDQYNTSQKHIQNFYIIEQYLSSNNFSSITIEGHTDERGTRDYNISLGQKRANALKKLILKNTDISEDQINIISYGKENPPVKCLESANICTGAKVWAKNRVAIIKLK